MSAGPEPSGARGSAHATSSVAVPWQLPPDVIGFAGRRGWLATLDALVPVQPPSPPERTVIAVISGTAGVGKTALAVHWAHHVAGRFPDGQLYVNLRGSTPGSSPLPSVRALQALVRSLGVPAEEVPRAEVEATALLRSLLARRRVLLLLDSAASEEQVRPLLPGGSGCVVLVTSRRRLTGLVALDGATRLGLDVLAADEAVDLLAGVVGERIHREPEAVALAAACGYLPLALRIAAARVLDQPRGGIGAFVAELTEGRGLNDLELDNDDAASVRVAFDSSYLAVLPAAQRLFRMLGLVPGPDVTVDAAAALAGIDRTEAERLLRRLASAHLIEEDESGRYAPHDLLRVYAREQCAAVETEAERRDAFLRLFTWYLRSADVAADQLYPHLAKLPIPTADEDGDVSSIRFADSEQAREWMDREHGNLLAAIRHAIVEGPGSLAGLLAACLRGYIWQHGQLEDWAGTLREALAVAREAGDRYGEAVTLHALGETANWHDRTDEAIDCFESAARIFADLGERYGEALCLSGQGVIHRVRGRNALADTRFRAAIEIFVETVRPRDEAIARHELGLLRLQEGGLDEAQRCFRRALELIRSTGFTMAEARPLRGLGMVQMRLGNDTEAERHLLAAIEASRRAGNRFAEAVAGVLIAEVELARGQHASALERLAPCLELYRVAGNSFNEALTLRVVGNAHLLADRPGRAREVLAEALEIWARLDMPLWHARCLVTMGDALAADGLVEEARAGWHRAAEMFGELGAPDAKDVASRLVRAAASPLRRSLWTSRPPAM